MKKKSIYVVIGSEFRRIRRMQDLTQRQVARRFKCTQQNINRIERGANMSIETFLKFCKFYNENPVTLFGLILQKMKSKK